MRKKWHECILNDGKKSYFNDGKKSINSYLTKITECAVCSESISNRPVFLEHMRKHFREMYPKHLLEIIEAQKNERRRAHQTNGIVIK